MKTPVIKDIGKSLFLNPTNDNGASKNNQHKKIENLTIELTALKVQEQFYIMKKRLEETIPESAKQLSYSSLLSEQNILEKKPIPKPKPSWHGCISDASLRRLMQRLRDISKRADLQISETSPMRCIKDIASETSLRSPRSSERRI